MLTGKKYCLKQTVNFENHVTDWLLNLKSSKEPEMLYIYKEPQTYSKVLQNYSILLY